MKRYKISDDYHKAIFLMVEDNQMDVELTINAFRKGKINNEILVINNGEEALDYLLGKREYHDRTQYPLPDLILLDIKLPGISGIEVLKIIKQTPIIKRIPVTILTSSIEERDRIKSYDYGANSYLEKPVSFLGFVEVVKKVCDYWIELNIKPPIERNLNRFKDERENKNSLH